MLTASQLRQAAALSGVRDIAAIEIDVELKNLLRKDQNPDLTAMIARVVGSFQFLGQMTESERTHAGDSAHRQRPTAETLAAALAIA